MYVPSQEIQFFENTSCMVKTGYRRLKMIKLSEHASSEKKAPHKIKKKSQVHPGFGAEQQELFCKYNEKNIIVHLEAFCPRKDFFSTL